MHYLFDENWFKKHQSKLLWLLNKPLIKIWFRWVMRIRGVDCPLKTRINKIAPNNFTFNQKLVLIDHIKLKRGWVVYDPNNRQHRRLSWKNPIEKRIALERTTDFRTKNKFSKRLFEAFYPIWYLAHLWDTLFANQWQPAWNLGFDTLTVYPDPHVEVNTVDGYVGDNDNALSWANLIIEGGAVAADNNASALVVHIQSGTTTNIWYSLFRSIFLFNTSDISAGYTITSTTLSLCGKASKYDGLGVAPDINIYSSAPASNTALAAGDFDSLGSTAFSTAIAYADWVEGLTAYNNFALNAAGLAAITKGGITKFGARNANYDVSGTPPTWKFDTFSSLKVYFAEEDLTTSDPKLVVTYSITVNHFLTSLGVGK